jgi:hypothetical protein
MQNHAQTVFEREHRLAETHASSSQAWPQYPTGKCASGCWRTGLK